MWTPVNEPLTTARFSCLYGHWYPHLRDLDATMRALAIECQATNRAMAAIRSHIPDAQLLVTEDFGKTFSTPQLQRQADHENERRWLTMDLLTGALKPDHPFHDRMLNAGVPGDALEELAEGDAAPDMIGFDHYLTSERFLDHRIGLYPGAEAGSNGQQTYVDLEAVRVRKLARQLGPAHRLREVWERYRLPMAVTEVHHGCSREEQARWFAEVWNAALKVRGEGADVRAVTMWAIFGAVDWRSLLTRRDNEYDVGGIDTRAERPRATFLAKTAAALARGETLSHPALELPGWWKRPGRTARRPSYDMLPRNCGKTRPILITGATGTLGQACARICAHRGLPHVITSRGDLDITDEASIAAAIERIKPWAVINTAGFVRTWEAHERQEECFEANVTGAELLARACELHDIPLVTFSSDLVFDGKLGRSYVEPDDPAPACVYGQSKAEAEQRVLATDSHALIVRTSAFFSPWDKYNFLFNTIDRLKRGEQVVVSDRTIVSPTYVPDLVHAALDLLLDGEKGIWHLTNQGAISWHELALRAADMASLDRRASGLIRREEDAEKIDTSLSSQRGLMLRPLDKALDDFARASSAF
jgi:dTDP-4-dehydrorhamnose reductase